MAPNPTGLLLEAHGYDRLAQVIALPIRHLGGRGRETDGNWNKGYRGKSAFSGVRVGCGVRVMLVRARVVLVRVGGLRDRAGYGVRVMLVRVGGLRVLACHNSVMTACPKSLPCPSVT